MKNAIYYIESLEILLSDHEKEERNETLNVEENKKELAENVIETKILHNSVTSLSSSLSQQKNYKSITGIFYN